MLCRRALGFVISQICGGRRNIHINESKIDRIFLRIHISLGLFSFVDSVSFSCVFTQTQTLKVLSSALVPLFPQAPSLDQRTTLWLKGN